MERQFSLTPDLYRTIRWKIVDPKDCGISLGSGRIAAVGSRTSSRSLMMVPYVMLSLSLGESKSWAQRLRHHWLGTSKNSRPRMCYLHMTSSARLNALSSDSLLRICKNYCRIYGFFAKFLEWIIIMRGWYSSECQHCQGWMTITPDCPSPSLCYPFIVLASPWYLHTRWETTILSYQFSQTSVIPPTTKTAQPTPATVKQKTPPPSPNPLTALAKYIHKIAVSCTITNQLPMTQPGSCRQFKTLYK